MDPELIVKVDKDDIDPELIDKVIEISVSNSEMCQEDTTQMINTNNDERINEQSIHYGSNSDDSDSEEIFYATENIF